MQSLHYPPHAVTALSSSCNHYIILLMQSLHYPPHAVIILLMQSLHYPPRAVIILLMQSLHYPPHAVTTLSSSCNHYIILLMQSLHYPPHVVPGVLHDLWLGHFQTRGGPGTSTYTFTLLIIYLLPLDSHWSSLLALCLADCLTSSLSLNTLCQNDGAGRTRIPHQCSAPCHLGLDHACV